MNFYWKLRMDYFAMRSSFLRKGWVETHSPRGPHSESFIWPTELHILLYYGVMNVLEWFSLQFPYKSEVKFFEKFRKYLELSLKTTSSWKTPLDLIKRAFPKENLEGMTNSFGQPVVKRCEIVLLKKFRYAPTLKSFDATSKELKWIFCTISLLVQVSRRNLLLSPS